MTGHNRMVSKAKMKIDCITRLAGKFSTNRLAYTMHRIPVIRRRMPVRIVMASVALRKSGLAPSTDPNILPVSYNAMKHRKKLLHSLQWF